MQSRDHLGEFMNRLLIVAILMLSTAPLYAQDQQQNVDKLKVDTRNAVGVIGADKRKTRTYCQIIDLRERQQADQENNKNKNKKLTCEQARGLAQVGRWLAWQGLLRLHHRWCKCCSPLHLR